MKQIEGTRRRRRASAGLLVSLSFLLAGGCDKSAPTEPAMFPTPAPTPTRVPTPVAGPLAGAWVGTMSGCTSITATVVQGGSSVSMRFTGVSPTFESACDANLLSFLGTLSGDSLSGRVTRAGNVFCASVSGPAAGPATPSHVHLVINRIPGPGATPFGPCPGVSANAIDLTRR